MERHLARVAQRIPLTPEELLPDNDATDAVIVHLWPAPQIVLDVALGYCAELKQRAPAGYADAFARLAGALALEGSLARRLMAAAGFQTLVAHGHESIALARVHRAAAHGPADLRAFLAAVRDHLRHSLGTE